MLNGLEQCDYTVDAQRASGFYTAIRRYWPGLPDGSLQSAYFGIRPKITGPGELAVDFRIDEPPAADIPVVNLFGIESRGLTLRRPLPHTTQASFALWDDQQPV
jgi:hypothetical protein